MRAMRVTMAATLARALELGCGDEWCCPSKVEALIAVVYALRPILAVEIGVWRGDSILPVLLAMKALDRGRAIVIDPWSASASAEGQPSDHAAWWGKVDHERARCDFLARLEQTGTADRCQIHREASSGVPPEAAGILDIDLLHVDGNHGPAALVDVDRFGPHVRTGGILILDDLDWPGGHVGDAAACAQRLGFFKRYPLGTGAVYQRAEVR